MKRNRAALSALLILCACGLGAKNLAYDPVTMDPRAMDRDAPAGMRQLSIESDGAMMNGIVYLAQGEGPHPTAILLHGFPGNERNLDLGQAIRRAGWNVLFFHYRGSWGSEGVFSLGHAIEDVHAAVAFLRAESTRFRVDPRKIALVGHSTGGFAALIAAARDPGIVGIAAVSVFNFGGYARILRDDPPKATEFSKALQKSIGPIHGTTGDGMVQEMIAEMDDFDLVDYAPQLANRPALLVSGKRDSTAVPDLHHWPLVRAFEATGTTELTQVLLDADHALTGKRIALARTVISWLHTLRPKEQPSDQHRTE